MQQEMDHQLTLKPLKVERPTGLFSGMKLSQITPFVTWLDMRVQHQQHELAFLQAQQVTGYRAIGTHKQVLRTQVIG